MCSTHRCISCALQSSVSRIFGAGKFIPNAELASAWQKQRADVVRGFHTGLFFVGHDCRPMSSVAFLAGLPVVSTLASSAPSDASSSASDTMIKMEVPPEMEVKVEVPELAPTAALIRSSKRKREAAEAAADEDSEAASTLEQVSSVRCCMPQVCMLKKSNA